MRSRADRLRARNRQHERGRGRGVLRCGQGDWAGAVADFDEALRLQPGCAEAYNNRGAARRAS